MSEFIMKKVGAFSRIHFLSWIIDNFSSVRTVFKRLNSCNNDSLFGGNLIALLSKISCHVLVDPCFGLLKLDAKPNKSDYVQATNERCYKLEFYVN